MTERPAMLAIVCAVLLVTSSGAAQNAPPVNDRANPYALVRNWPRLPMSMAWMLIARATRIA